LFTTFDKFFLHFQIKKYNNFFIQQKLFKKIYVPNIIRMVKTRRMRWAGDVTRMRRGMHIGYWWESQRRVLGRQRRWWVDNIKIDLR
jgi:hypothetical protein